MNLDYQHLLPNNFDTSSRVWIYQSNRLLAFSESIELEDLLEQFVLNWKSHGTPVKGYANLFFGQFIVLMADETHSGISGCSTDSSVNLMKEIEKKISIQLFNRQMLAFVVNNKIQILPIQQVQYALNNGILTENVLYFNNLVQTKAELLSQWIIPLNKSWLGKKVLVKNT
jgi:hypothetical protein